MMFRSLCQFQQFDAFGAMISLKALDGSTQYKTYIGGVFTVILYSLSLAYALYVLQDWINGGILPRVSNQLVTNDFISLDLPQQFMSLHFQQLTNSPFKENGNIITPLVTILANGELLKIIPLFSENNKIFVKDIGKLQYSSGQHEGENKPQIMAVLTLVPCKSTLLTADQSCASDQEIEAFLKSYMSVVSVTIQIQQFNSKSNSIEQIEKSTFLVMEHQSILYTQIKLETTAQFQDNGFFLASYRNINYASNYQLNSQTVSDEFIEYYFGTDYKPLGLFLIQMDELQNEQIIVYPKLGEIFATIGSIASLLFSVSFLIVKFNVFLFTEDLIETIIKTQYPKYSQLEIKRNFLRQIQTVHWHNQEFKIEQFQERINVVRNQCLNYLKLPKLLEKIVQFQDVIDLQKYAKQIDDPNSDIKSEIRSDRNSQKIQPMEIDIENNHIDEVLDISCIFRKTNN